MKNLEKLNIDPDKLMENDELVNLKGGAENPCGTGFVSWDCLYMPYYPEELLVAGTVCALESQHPYDAIYNVYPQALILLCKPYGELNP